MTDVQKKQASWDELKEMEPHQVQLDEFREGLRFVILRGPCAVCAYVGFPLTHPLAGFNYDELPVNAHGGLTFSGPGTETVCLDQTFYWYGWNYAHSGDACFYDKAFPIDSPEVRWDVAMVDDDAWSTLDAFRTLAALARILDALAEAISRKAGA